MRVAIAATLALAAVLWAPAMAASLPASQGSVPAEVRAFVADGLVAQLVDVYGPGTGGTGIDFDDSTEGTAIWRVFGWSDAVPTGDGPDDPVVLRNEWAVPVAMAGAPLGLALVWINPERSLPELAEFTAGAELATALAAVPDAAWLVHDESRSAWLALADGVVTPLVPGTSGLTGPVPVGELPRPERSVPDPVPAGPSSLPLALAAVAGLVAIVVIALLIPGRLRPPPVMSVDVVEPEPEPEPELVAAPAPEPVAALEPEPEPVAAPPKKPRAPSAPRKPPTPKPTTPKPKPTTPKPPAPKPTTAKPTTAKPTTKKPARPEPRTPRPKPPGGG